MPARLVPHRRSQAIVDVNEHAAFIADADLDAALRYLDAIEATVEFLCKCPEAGGKVPTTSPETNGLRAKLVVGFSNYVLLYRVSEERLDVLRVVRGGQEIDRIALSAR